MDNQRQTELAYYAGLIDGEGSIIIAKQTSHPTRKTPMHVGILQVGMVTREPLDDLQRLFGGSVRVDKVRAPGYRPMYRWACTGRNITTRALLQLYPFLRVKKPQAQRVLDLNLNWLTPVRRDCGVSPVELQRREALYREVRQLNVVGVAATTKRESVREHEAIV